MTSGTGQLRLLPWAGPEGKPCYLAGDGTGYLSRLADNTEATQLALAGELFHEATQVLDNRQWTPGELHLLAVELAEALGNVHRIAASRGARLPAPADDDLDTGEGLEDEEDGQDELLGHAHIGVATDVYAHVRLRLQRQAIDALAAQDDDPDDGSDVAQWLRHVGFR
ncbi:hypothetical protein ACWC24_37280 [Streptomyces sp. NPDC001443]